jgi:N-acetylglucosamine kinase-like BadF-type ATPase
MTNDPSYVLGIDGGGTKTIAWLAPLEEGNEDVALGRGQAGPGNPRAAGFETAQANIEAAIAAAYADAKLPQAIAAAACFGLAGAGRPAEQERIAAWATNRGIAKRVRVTGDAEPILAAAAGDLRGIALICGTGSLAWGRNQSGQTARSGGWGYLLGDEGSGYWIARAGLQAAVQAADGRAQPTVLLEAMLAALEANAPDDLVGIVYGPEMTRERLADLSRVVFEAAAHDAVARAIVEQAAEQLAAMVGALRQRLELRPGQFPLALAGGVIVSQPLLRTRLDERLSAIGASPAAVGLVAEPVRGAVVLARHLARS